MNFPQSSITQVASDLYRVSVAMPPQFIPGGFLLNKYLLMDEQPLLFHTLRRTNAATYSPKGEKQICLLCMRTLWNRVKPSAGKWTISQTVPMPRRT